MSRVSPPGGFVAPTVTRDALRNMKPGETIVVDGGKRSGASNTLKEARRVSAVASSMKIPVCQHNVLLVDPATHQTKPAIVVYRIPE